jgi:hypothetical protein
MNIICSFASTMAGQSDQLIQDKSKDMMKAIIGRLQILLILLIKSHSFSGLFHFSFTI